MSKLEIKETITKRHVEYGRFVRRALQKFGTKRRDDNTLVITGQTLVENPRAAAFVKLHAPVFAQHPSADFMVVNVKLARARDRRREWRDQVIAQRENPPPARWF